MRKLEASRAIWPIHYAAARQPEGWRGWPDGKKFAFVLSHDVEGQSGLDKCRRLAELEASLGFHSSFNLIPEGSYAIPKYLREWLTDHNFEVGVHDLHHNGQLYLSRESFRRSAGSINRHLKEWGAVGFRSGFMFHQLDWIHDLDIEYDSSTFDTDPFEPQPDGTGIIFPFWVPPPEDHPTGKGFVELPYTLPQDSTLFLILREKSPAIWLSKLDWVARQGGMALVNVHPDYLQFPGERANSRTFPIEHYVSLLQHVRDAYSGTFWHALPREVARAVAPCRPRHQVRQAKRVCLVTYSFYERDSRVSRYGEALSQNGDEVEVLSLRSSPQLLREEIVNGCHVVRLQERPINEKSLWAFVFRLNRFLWHCSGWIARNHARRPFDLIHVHNVPDFLVLASWRAKLGGAKIILDIHDIVPELFESKFGVKSSSLTVLFLRWMEYLSAAFSDHIILANHLWYDLYTKRSSRTEKVSVMINFVDRDVFFPRPRIRTDDRKIVLFPGSLQWHQGLDVAIASFPKVVAEVPKAELHIYGDGQAKSSLINLATGLGLDGHVRFFDFVPTREIAAVMAEADVGVVPKRADSFGNEAFSTKIFEFMSLGVPVVASSTRIDRYYFNDSVLRFFPSGDSAALAEEILKLLRFPEETGQMVKRATEFAEKNSWGERAADYLQVVDRICSDANRISPSPSVIDA